MARLCRRRRLDCARRGDFFFARGVVARRPSGALRRPQAARRPREARQRRLARTQQPQAQPHVGRRARHGRAAGGRPLRAPPAPSPEPRPQPGPPPNQALTRPDPKPALAQVCNLAELRKSMPTLDADGAAALRPPKPRGRKVTPPPDLPLISRGLAAGRSALPPLRSGARLPPAPPSSSAPIRRRLPPPPLPSPKVVPTRPYPPRSPPRAPRPPRATTARR